MTTATLSPNIGAFIVPGMGATRFGYSDRDPFTVVEVLSPKRIKVRQCRAIRTDENGMSECQNYEYEEDAISYPLETYSLRKNGHWVLVGSEMGGSFLYVGDRRKYHDFSF